MFLSESIIDCIHDECTNERVQISSEGRVHHKLDQFFIFPALVERVG